MFKFLKEKLKSVVSKFSQKIEEEGKPAVKPEAKIEEIKKEKIIEKPEIKIEEKKLEVKKEKHIEEKVELKKEEEKPEIKEIKVEKKAEAKPEPEKEEVREEKKGIFGRIAEAITTKKISAQQFDAMFWDMETALLENSVAVEVIDKIKDDLKDSIVDKPIPRSKSGDIITDALRESIDSLFVEPENLVEKIKQKKPFVILFVGINGSGKTTTIAKTARYLQKNKLSCVLAASDTFRAAAIDQLQVHADKLGVKLIKHAYGADPAAVAFDAIAYAKAHSIDAVLIDTAGRMHSNVNLMDEMKKIVRVAKPDMKIFVGEAITGNDCTEQARKFNEAVGIDAIILAKADIDEKGGASISVSYVTQKPILFLGAGQGYDDLQIFDKQALIKNLGL